jgi:hypothetical protein
MILILIQRFSRSLSVDGVAPSEKLLEYINSSSYWTLLAHMILLYNIAAANRETIWSNMGTMNRAITLLEKLSARVNQELSEEVKSIRDELEQQKEKVEATLEPIRAKIEEDKERQKRGSGIYR